MCGGCGPCGGFGPSCDAFPSPCCGSSSGPCCGSNGGCAECGPCCSLPERCCCGPAIPLPPMCMPGVCPVLREAGAPDPSLWNPCRQPQCYPCYI